MSTSHPALSEGSPRTLLEAIARAGAMSTSGVAGLAGREVVVVAQDAERYAVDLELRAELVPLADLSERVAVGVRAAAATAGMSDQLGEVTVRVVDIADPTDTPA